MKHVFKTKFMLLVDNLQQNKRLTLDEISNQYPATEDSPNILYIPSIHNPYRRYLNKYTRYKNGLKTYFYADSAILPNDGRSA